MTRADHCYECGFPLEGRGPGVVCKRCDAVNYVYDTGALPHLISRLSPLDPAQRLTEYLGELGLSCRVEDGESLYVPCYLFTSADGKSFWEPAFDDLVSRFVRRYHPPTSKLESFIGPDDQRRLLVPTVSPQRAAIRLGQRGMGKAGSHCEALVHLPAERLRYRVANRRSVALALVDSIYTENPPESVSEPLDRLRLYIGGGTAAVVLATTVLLGGWGGALLALVESLAGTILLASQSRRED